jgi:hypothetical protein
VTRLRFPRKAVLLAGGALLAVFGAGGGAALASGGSSSPTQLSPQFVVRDGSGNSLAVQVQQGVASSGAFDFLVGGVGDWVGVIPLAPISSNITHLKGTVTAAFQATGTGTTTPAGVRMEGEVDTVHQTATVNVWVTLPGGQSETHYLLQTSPGGSVAAAQAVVGQVLSALETQSWSTLYTLSAPEVTQQYTEAQYVQMLSSQQHPVVENAALSGTGSTQVLDGYTYFTQPVTFTSVVAGNPSTYTAVISLVWENGQWALIGTTGPQPSS